MSRVGAAYCRELSPSMSGKLPMPSVLVVDDEPLIRWSLSQALSESGYLVRLAGNAAEARAALSALEPPQVVLLDLRLPDSTNLDLLREIRRRFPDTPVVMMSAHGTYAMASISTRSPGPGSPATCTVVRAGRCPPNMRE